MNAVEISEAVAELFEQPMEAAEFPYEFLRAFGNKDATIARLKTGNTNQSDVGGVLQRGNIHLAVAPQGGVEETLAALRGSPATKKYKAKFILATDGTRVEAEELASGDPLSCAWEDFPDHFGMFLPLAGISTIREISENAFDIRATAKLNKLYLALLEDNPDWATEKRRPDMNHFMARLIFSFFAEDTGIFADERMFTDAVRTMSAADSSNTHEVIGEIFQAMNTRHVDREQLGLPRWAARFPYVNGGLFAGSLDVPRFSRTARSYLIQVGTLDWKQINPDIFGSMIQAVADDDERGALGMHYTSVPNILKVLNPLFLDELREKLEASGDNARMLLNLRKRISRIRVFDPACGSGNFLVIAYKELRALEHEINCRRGEQGRASEIPLTNFRGIELRDFAAEIARLALIIAEFQCDELFRGQKDAIQDFLPLDAENWITCGNALRLDWLSICPPTGRAVKLAGDDLFSTPLDQSEIDFENAGGETYICGNPPYLGSRWRDSEQQSDLATLFSGRAAVYKDLDYVAGWLLKGADYVAAADGARCGFVATKSVCQGEQVAMLWPLVFGQKVTISFAYRPFDWKNLARGNAGVTVVIVGLARQFIGSRKLYDDTDVQLVRNIGPYLVAMDDIVVEKRARPINGLPRMDYGNKPSDGGHLILERAERDELLRAYPEAQRFVRPYVGSSEYISGIPRFCVWIWDRDVGDATQIPEVSSRIQAVQKVRSESKGSQAKAAAKTPHRFVFAPHRDSPALIVPRVTSERRPYLPVGMVDPGTIVSDRAAVVYDPEPWLLSIVASRLHLIWVANVCVRMRTDFSYSNTLGWNTFPIPALTAQNRTDLSRCAEDILLVRESYFPATIAELYDPDMMPRSLREAHERNDDVLERIYIGRRFRNDTERLEKLFAMYSQTAGADTVTNATKGRRRS